MNTHHTEIIEYYQKVRRRTMRVITLIPPDKAGWSYLPGKFTLSDHVRHIALIERDMFIETFLGRSSKYQGCGREFGESLQDAINLLEKTHRETLAVLERTMDHNWSTDCLTPTGHPVSRINWIHLMLEHEIHHRAQIYLCLNMLGIPTVPMYGLTAEELQNLST